MKTSQHDFMFFSTHIQLYVEVWHRAESWILTKILVFQVSMIKLKSGKRVKGICDGTMIKIKGQGVVKWRKSNGLEVLVSLKDYLV